MTMRPPNLPSPGELAEHLSPPARDLLRGVRKAISGPLRMLEPVGAMFPGPVQHLMQDIGASVDRGARAVSGAEPAAKAQSLARAMATPVFSGAGDASTRFARAAYFGLSLVLRRMGRDDLLVSETVAGLAFRAGLAPCGPDRAPAWKAAAVAVSLMRHHAIGVAPSTGIGLDAQDMADSRMAIFTLMLWLLTERPLDVTQEAALLDLCHEVAASQSAQIAQAGEDVEMIAGLLDALSRLI